MSSLYNQCLVIGMLICCAIPLSHSGSLRVGAFNVQTFGTKKYGNETLMGYIQQVIRRYDVVLIQEIRDASGVVIPGLLEKLRDSGEAWDVSYSERLGRSTYKEQYAYYFRTDRLSLVSSYQFDDGPDDGTDVFAREPYGVLLQTDLIPGLSKLGLLGIHAAPDEANVELNHLDEVYEAAKAHWNTEDIMIMGDFNADCSYMNDAELSALGLRTDNTFTWLIGDEVDTTISTNTHCSYDRIVAAGSALLSSINAASASEYRFDLEYGLTYDMARAVSDHYPVELLITSNGAYSGSSPSPSASSTAVIGDITTPANIAFRVDGSCAFKLSSCCLMILYFMW